MPALAKSTTLSACACVSATPTTTTLAGYYIVSPTACPRSTPTGTVIGQSDSTFSAENGGLQYQQYPNSQFIFQEGSNGPFFVDLSSSSSISISDTEGDTLIINADDTFEAFAGNCELELVGTLPALSPVRKEKRVALDKRQASSPFCTGIQFFCTGNIGPFIAGYEAAGLCLALGVDLGTTVGAAIGFLGNLAGPEVGVPTTIEGAVLGGRVGAFLASTFGQKLCGAIVTLATAKLCEACAAPPTGCTNPGVCGTYNAIDSPSCGPLGDCICVTDASGHSVCVEDVSCSSATCSTNADCGSGNVCWVGGCCSPGVNYCATPSGICLNPSSRKFIFRSVAAGMATKRDGCTNSGRGCTWFLFLENKEFVQCHLDLRGWERYGILSHILTPWLLVQVWMLLICFYWLSGLKPVSYSVRICHFSHFMISLCLSRPLKQSIIVASRYCKGSR